MTSIRIRTFLQGFVNEVESASIHASQAWYVGSCSRFEWCKNTHLWRQYRMLRRNWNQALQLGNNSLCNIKVLTSKAYSDLLQLEVIESLSSLSPPCVKRFLNIHSDTVGCCDILYLFNYRSRYSGLEQWWSKHVVSRSGIWHCSSRRGLQPSWPGFRVSFLFVTEFQWPHQAQLTIYSPRLGGAHLLSTTLFVSNHYPH